MRKTRGWDGLRLTIATLGLCGAVAGRASADAMVSSDSLTPGTVTPTSTGTDASSTGGATVPLKAEMTYTTSGSIGTTGIKGPNVISYIPEASGQIMTPSAFSLGTFIVGYMPPGTTTTYDRTPFSITYTATKVNGSDPSVNESPVTLTGFLNGTVGGPNQSDVVATFNPIDKPTFLTDNYINTLSVLDPQVSLVPSTTNFGRTTAQAHLKVAPAPPVPEPTTIALFLTTIAGVGLRHRFRRQAEQA